MMSGVPKTTLLRRNSNRSAPLPSRGRPPALPLTLELELAKDVNAAHDAGKSFTLADVRELALAYAADAGIRGFKATPMWMVGFKRRHGFAAKLGKPVQVPRAACFNKEAVEGFYNTLEDAYAIFKAKTGKDAGPDDIANMDETAFSVDKVHGRKVIVPAKSTPKYIKRASHTGHVTAVCCGLASGKEMAPLLIFEGVRAASSYLSGAPGFTIAMAPKGFMTTEIFVDWLHRYAAWMNRTSILVLDWHSSRHQLALGYYCRKLKIIPVMLPANTTHKLQPADVGVFGPLKQRFNNAVQHMGPGAAVTKHNVATIIYKAIHHLPWSAVVPDDLQRELVDDNWTSGFKATGIMPFDKTKRLNDPELRLSTLVNAPRDEVAPSAAGSPAAPAAGSAAADVTAPAAGGGSAVDRVRAKHGLEGRLPAGMGAKITGYVKEYHPRLARISTRAELMVAELEAARQKAAKEATKEKNYATWQANMKKHDERVAEEAAKAAKAAGKAGAPSPAAAANAAAADAALPVTPAAAGGAAGAAASSPTTPPKARRGGKRKAAVIDTVEEDVPACSGNAKKKRA